MDPACTWSRIIAVTELVIFWQVTELNTFFLKHIFEVPPGKFLECSWSGSNSVTTTLSTFSQHRTPGTDWFNCGAITSTVLLLHDGRAMQASWNSVLGLRRHYDDGVFDLRQVRYWTVRSNSNSEHCGLALHHVQYVTYLCPVLRVSSARSRTTSTTRCIWTSAERVGVRRRS